MRSSPMEQPPKISAELATTGAVRPKPNKNNPATGPGEEAHLSTSTKKAPAKKKARAKASKRNAPAKKKAPVPKKAPKISRQEIGRQVAVELSKVRAVLKEVGSGVVDRLDGEAASLALFLEGESLPGEKPLLPSARTLKSMLVAFGGLKVKPKKGRVKDLARIELLLVALACKMPPVA